MSVADNIMRVLHALESARLAAKVLLAVLLLAVLSWFLRDSFRVLGEELGIGPLPVYGVLALAVYALAVLLVEGGVRLGAAVARARSERTRVRKAEAEAQVLKRKQTASLKHFLDHAPEEYIRPLRELMSSGEKEYMRSGELVRLESIGAVERLVETRRHYAVFRLAVESEPIVRAHFDDERESHVREQVKTLTENELAFLKLFAVTQSQYEDPDRTDLLPHEAYSGGQSLKRKEFLTRVGVPNERLRQRWSVLPDAKAAIETEYDLVFTRDSVELGLDRVESSVGSGGGAR